MSALPAPKARPAAAGAAMVLALLLVGVAIVAVHDLAVVRGWASGSSWTGLVADRLDGRTADGAVLAAGIIALVVGSWLVWLALKPARRTHAPALVDGDVWVTDRALAAVAHRAAENTPGVAEASVKTRRSRVVVTVASDRAEASTTVESAVRRALDGFTSKDVTVRTEKIS